MKKTAFLLLLIAAAFNSHVIAQSYFSPNSTPVSKAIFSPTEPGKQQCNFFVWLPSKNRIWFDLQQVADLSSLPNLDSLFMEVGDLLLPMLDSFAADGVVRMIEVDVTREPALFRVTQHNQPQAYTTLHSDITALKIDQDTIRIKIRGFHKDAFCYVSLLLNNAIDITTLAPGTGLKARELVINAVEQKYKVNTPVNTWHKYYAVVNIETGKLVSPYSYKAIRSQNKNFTLKAPFSLGFARGQFLTGVSVLAEYHYGNHPGYDWGSDMMFGLAWQPLFGFRQDGNGKTTIQRNDFLTLSFMELPYKQHAGFRFVSSLSLGYLVRRQGEIFEANTFKVGLPSLRNGSLFLEPEFYFNNFFKNVSPGIKIRVNVF